MAHAGIAYTCYQEINQGFGDNPAEWLAQGLAAGDKAVSLDDKDGFTHLALGRVLGMAGHSDRAIAELEKSVALNPNFAHGYFGLGQTLLWYGRAADGIPKLDMAMRLSPQDSLLWTMQTVRANCCTFLGNCDEGVEWARKAANARPDLFWVHINLAAALSGQDRLDEARVTINAARRLKPNLSLSEIRRLTPHFHPDYLDRRLDALRKAGLPK